VNVKNRLRIGRYGKKSSVHVNMGEVHEGGDRKLFDRFKYEVR